MTVCRKVYASRRHHKWRQNSVSPMQFRWRHIENPFEKALRSSSFSRGLFTAIGSLFPARRTIRLVRAGRAPHGVCGNAANFSRSLATARKTVIGVFLPEVNSGKRRKLLYALRAYIEFSENDSFRQEKFLKIGRNFFGESFLHNTECKNVYAEKERM